jgi:hypothetical protein
MWCLTSITPASGRLWQEKQEFEASLDSIAIFRPIWAIFLICAAETASF